MVKVPVNESTAPKERFDNFLRALLAVQKSDLQDIDAKLKAVQKEKDRRKTLKPKK
jgi:hypothetical protein